MRYFLEKTMVLVLRVKTKVFGRDESICSFYWSGEGLNGRYYVEAWKEFESKKRYAYWKIDNDIFYFKHYESDPWESRNHDELINEENKKLLIKAIYNSFEGPIFGE